MRHEAQINSYLIPAVQDESGDYKKIDEWFPGEDQEYWYTAEDITSSEVKKLILI